MSAATELAARVRTTMPAVLSLGLLLLTGCDSSPDHAGAVPPPPLASSQLPALRPAHPTQTQTNEAQKEPRIVSWDELEKYYPQDAMDRGVDGFVEIAVTLDKAARATDTHILTESPPDLGFGAAASALAHAMTYSNPTGRPAVLTFDVKFAPPPDRIPRHRHGHHAGES